MNCRQNAKILSLSQIGKSGRAVRFAVYKAAAVWYGQVSHFPTGGGEAMAGSAKHPFNQLHREFEADHNEPGVWQVLPENPGGTLGLDLKPEQKKFLREHTEYTSEREE